MSEGRIPCPRRAVLWRQSGTARLDLAEGFALVPVWRTALLVKRTDSGTSYSAELDAETPYFVEVREGPPPVGAPDRPEGDLGPLLERLDLDGDAMVDRFDAEPVLFGEAPDEVLLVAELSLERGGWHVELVT